MITQEDRDAAALIFDHYAPNYATMCRNGSDLADKLIIPKTLSAHRIAAEKAVLTTAWIIADSNGLVSLAELERKLEQQP